MMTILTAYGILSDQLLDSGVFDLASSLVYELEPRGLLNSILFGLLYVLGRHGFPKRGQRLQFMQLHDTSGLY